MSKSTFLCTVFLFLVSANFYTTLLAKKGCEIYQNYDNAEVRYKDLQRFLARMIASSLEAHRKVNLKHKRSGKEICSELSWLHCSKEIKRMAPAYEPDDLITITSYQVKDTCNESTISDEL